MPKEVKEIKDFLLMVKDKDIKHILIHKKTVNTPGVNRYVTPASKQITKFKLRGPNYLYTLTLDNKEKARKLANSLPTNLVKYTSDKKRSKKK